MKSKFSQSVAVLASVFVLALAWANVGPSSLCHTVTGGVCCENAAACYGTPTVNCLPKPMQMCAAQHYCCNLISSGTGGCILGGLACTSFGCVTVQRQCTCSEGPIN